MPSANGGSVLLVEDEETLAESVQFALEVEGYEVTSVGDGRDAVTAVGTRAPDLVLLDLMLPGLSGLDVLRTIRRDHQMPVIILTAKDAEADKVLGLELGADDYVTKPFSMRELIARVRSQLRRSRLGGTHEESLVIRGGDVEMDIDRHEVRVRGDEIALRPKEFDLLFALLARKGKLVTRDTLISEVWGYDYVGDTKTLDVHIKRLRKKVEADPASPALIVTVRGLGYKFVGD
ncbi:MAG: response regulator transcription factor [Candidatus Sulfomarinibacteraceae bacterium]